MMTPFRPDMSSLSINNEEDLLSGKQTFLSFNEENKASQSHKQK